MKNITVNPWAPDLWSITKGKEDITLPKITFGIISFNRKDDLRRTLDCLTRAIQYPDYEVIVIDNASGDGSSVMVEKEFPEVRLIPLKKNFGVSARNLIFKEARGEFIFFNDDDSFPATPATIYNIVRYMLDAKDVCALSTVVIQPHNFVCETKGWNWYSSKNSDGTYEGIYFHEAGGCIRRSRIGNIRFDEDNLFYAEGHDFSLRLFNTRKKMILHPGFAVLHAKSNAGHSRSKFPRLKASNMIKMLFKNFNLLFAWFLVLLYCIRRIIGFLIRPSTTLAYIKGIIEGIRNRKKYIAFEPKISKVNLLRLFKWYLFMLRW